MGDINDLKYGHFGPPTYSIDDGAWLFGRSPGHGRQLRQLGSWKTAVVSPVQQVDTPDFQPAATTTTEAAKAAKAIIRNHPDLIPSVELLPGEALASAAVTSTVQTYDPAMGALLSFGSISFKGTYRNTQRVAAVAAGENGSLLRLIVLSKIRSGWSQDGSVSVEGLSFVNTTSGYWNQDATPLQQVCFAQGDARSSFLAVRTPTRTNIFRPVLHRRDQPAQQSSFYDLPPSLLDPNLVLSILNEQTGGEPHADVTFNPDYQRQFGLIDHKGNWSLWEFERRPNISPGYERFASCTVVGQIRAEAETMRAQRRDDGWARITWIGDVNTILVCSRKTAEVFNVRGGQSTPLNCPSLLPERSPSWILDVKVVPMNKHRFCVLTSTRLFLLAVTCQDDLVPTIDSERGVRVLLSWTHFRGADDISLQLSVLSATEHGIIVSLFSRLNRLITIFRFDSHESSPNDLYSSSDPLPINLDDEAFGMTGRSTQINSIYMERLEYRQRQKANDSPGLTSMTENVQFYRVSILLSDLSVQQAVFYSFETDEQDISKRQSMVEPLTWDRILRMRGIGVKSSVVVQEDEDFIVPDGADGVSLSGTSATSSRLPGSLSDQLLDHSQWDDRFISNMKDLYDALTARVDLADNAEESLCKAVDIAHVMDQIGSLLNSNPPPEEDFPGTMFELVKGAMGIPDIDDASHRFQALLSPKEQTQPLGLQCIASSRVLRLEHNNVGPLDMASVYDNILENWIAPLPPNFPHRLRQVKEHLARRIAAEVMLSAARVHRSGDVDTTSVVEAEPARESQDSAVAFPILPSRATHRQAELRPFTSSQLEPLSVQTGAPETAAGVSSNPIARLSRHVQITKPPPIVPPNIGNVLTHWTLGADPHTYDWVATERIMDEEATSDDEAGQKDKERLKRKAERLLKRQRRELEREKKQSESQPLFGREVGGLRSSPAPAPALGFDSSSQAQSQTQTQSQGFEIPGFVQSQVEPGKHGGRPVKKKKGKGRISGF
ncbi:hypothetical protein K491DRAFT_774371 [Lophiostoma macrostomum CBS 122681]|uniref:RNA polymerase I-specific transcription initiation factor RRN6-like protein n=1 Tax=Lophiostoma macrostomum CBS 122681 TaxID=1314788 RepID=A0A6A6TPI2_9PLEO|nr:hypothetical protein K491DRAFT_774371 [Lophiostoma macrostomum CBS 122681]